MIPAVSLTASRIYLPTLSSSASRLTSTDGTTIFATVAGIDPDVTITRFSVAKHLGWFGLAAGTSKSKYDYSANVNVWSSDGSITDGTFSLSSRGSRRNKFLDASLSLGDRVSIEAEIGRLSGWAAPGALTRFGGRPTTDARTYITTGVRMTLGKLYSSR